MKRIGLVIGVLVLMSSSFVRAQWRVVANFPGTSVNAVIFLDDVGTPSVGLVGLKNGGLYRTSDRGQTWTLITIAKGVSGEWDFTFADSLRGWAASPIGVIRTTDGGKSWSKTPLTAQIHSVYYHHGMVFANGPYVPARISDDGGSGWYDSGPQKMLGTVFANDTIGIRTSFDSLFEYTTDGGLTWRSSAFGQESWQPTYLGHGKSFVAASETFIGTDRIYQTANGGVSWFQLYDFGSSGKLTGTIRGNAKALYVQSDVGVAVSTNGGTAWASICGPPQLLDTRFWAHGDTVYAGDMIGNLWMTPTGTNGPDDSVATFSDSALRFFSAACSRTVSSLSISDRSNCQQLRTEVLAIDIVGGNNRFLLEHPIQMPHFFSADEKIDVTYYPDQETHDTAYLHVQYRKEDEIRDTLIPLYGHRIPSVAYTIGPSPIQRTLANPCTLIDTIITLVNAPCERLTIDSIWLANGTLSLETPSLPADVLPDSSFSIHLFFSKRYKGTYVDTVNVKLHGTAGAYQSAVPAVFAIRADLHPIVTLSPSWLRFGQLSICSPQRQLFRVGNPICRDEVLRKVWLTPASTPFTIVSMPPTRSNLASGTDDSVWVEFAPHAAGNFSAQLNCEYELDGVVHDSMVLLSGTGSMSIATSVAVDSLDFGSHLMCDSVVLSTIFENRSCDSVCITSITGTGGSGFHVLQPIAPQWVHAGESTPIVVRHRAVGSGADVATLDILAQNAGALSEQRIQLTATTIADTNGPALTPLSIQFGDRSPCVLPDTIVYLQNRLQCDSLHLDSTNSATGETAVSIDSGIRTIGSGERVVLRLAGHATDAGDIADTLRIYSHSSGGRYQSVLFVRGRIVGERRALGADVQSLDLGTLHLCDTKDTLIELRNTGCDTTHITSVSVRGTGFELVGAAFPCSIAPAQTYTLRLRAMPDSSGGMISNLAIITVNSDASEPTMVISTRFNISFPSALTLHILPARMDVGNADTISVAFILSGELPPDLRRLRFALQYNTDLLTLVGNSGPNAVSSPDARSFESTGAPLLRRSALDSSIGSLLLLGALSVDSATRFECTQIQAFNAVGELSTCQVVLSSTSSEVGYRFGCADGFMQHYLRSHHAAFESVSVSPNPATDIAYLGLVSAECRQATLELISAEGVTVVSQTVDLPRGRCTIPVGLSQISDGAYFLRISSGPNTRTVPVTKVTSWR